MTLDRIVVSGEEHDHGLAAQPTRDEGQAPCGRLVEPLSVVGDDEHRPFPGQLPDERQHGHTDQKPVRHVAAHPERPVQGLGLRLRECADPLRHRPQQFVQRGERQPRLQASAPAPQDGEVHGG
ncbi:hypothetical protein OG622_11630 [Streptomyces sp. NBC_01314]|nr:hypothetical protein OG622_11630 [Streptomyces sp. NBC_01314]